ncbi:DNA mismatch repair protein MutS domain protein [Paludibacter propionicigenes WB4]|uniref:DNA mismatch repair protein MutS domain protein n=2 Tax=Paludibacter TaxID=346096 RepID=E4T434_PALPW|nr:DNA mismatch repair protein MutS domain protein [Paludibacter propionicigenes WB4]
MREMNGKINHGDLLASDKNNLNSKPDLVNSFKIICIFALLFEYKLVRTITMLSKQRLRKTLLESFGKPKDDLFDFELIKKYFHKKNHSDEFQVLSDKTCNDLDFEELFMFIDRTSSRIGQQHLYNKLRTIPRKPNNTANTEKIISELSQNSELRLNVQTLLARLNEREAYYISLLFQYEHIKPPKWFFMVKFLSFTSLLLIIAFFFNLKVILLIIPIFIINLIIHYTNKKNLYQYLGSVPQLIRLNNTAKKLFENDLFQELNPTLRESTGIIDKIQKQMLFFKLESKLQSDLEVIISTIFELLKTAFLIEPLFLFDILKKMDTRRKEIEDIFLFVGEIDTLISIASLREGLSHYCLPTVTERKTLSAKDIFHPLIANCVENSINLNHKSILLTGSNMSGKTSFIRTIGLNAITGQTINTCFATEFSMPKMNIFSAIRINDDLMNDKSYYFEEVLTIKEMIKQSSNESANLFLLDEIFKGTNTIERIAAGKAVLSSLNLNDNIVFVSTHDIELTDLLKNEYELYHFSESINNQSVDFDYKLKNGKLKNRNAIRILQINDYPEDIISEAYTICKVLEETSFTAHIQKLE